MGFFSNAMNFVSDVISPDNEETVRQRLTEAFDTFYEKMDSYKPEDVPKAREEYQADVRHIASTFPQGFSVWQKRNTDARIERLNELAMQEAQLPQDEYVQRLAQNAMQIPYGYSQRDNLDPRIGNDFERGLRGFTRSDQDNVEYWRHGEPDDVVDRHEVQHNLQENLEFKHDHPIASEENLNRGFDILRKVLSNEALDEFGGYPALTSNGYQGTVSESIQTALDVGYPDWESNLTDKEKKYLETKLWYETPPKEGNQTQSMVMTRNGWVVKKSVPRGDVLGVKDAVADPEVQRIIRKAVGDVMDAQEYEDLLKTGFESTIK
jgi:hypothetical protein